MKEEKGLISRRNNHIINGVTWNKLIKKEIYSKVLFLNFHFTNSEDFIQFYQIAYHSKSAVFPFKFCAWIRSFAVVKLMRNKKR